MSMGDIHPPKAAESHRETDGDEATVIGLARNPSGVPFRCGACKYFDGHACQNPHPKLRGKIVDPICECCNLYDHPGMRRIID